MESAIILDTNVLSEMVRAQPDPAVTAWFLRQDAERLCTTSITLAEVSFGIRLMPPGKRRDRLTHLSRALFEEALREKILPFDEFAAHHYADLRASRKIKGQPMTAFDAQIAAIALATGASIATRNTPDFEHCGVRLINPWLP